MLRRTRERRKYNAEINVVPYIDVMMVLLVIFMITAPMLTQGVSVDLPQAAADPVDANDQEPVIISVDHAGRYYINIGGDENQAVTGGVILERVEKILSSNPQQLLLVRGDQSVSYDQVIQLMVLLQKAGASRVGLVTE